MRITLIIPSLSRGGAERIMSALANLWAEQGRAVTLLTFDHGDTPAYRLSPVIEHRRLGLLATSRNAAQGFFRNLWRVRRLRRAIRESKADVVISFMDITNVLTVLATRGLRTRVVISERIDPSLHDIGRAWSALRRLTYGYADAVVCQTDPALRWVQHRVHINGRVIPNPVVAPMARTGAERGAGAQAPTIVAMGRLVPQKGFDLLLQAFAQIASRHPEWTLKIIGTGPLRAELERQAAELRIADRVQLVGELADPFPLVGAAELFVLSSRFEGFANALCEAMAMGLPVISFDCPSSPAEIIRHGENGILVPAQDVPALASAMDHLMGDAALRRRLASRAPEVLSRYAPEKILALWDELFRELGVLQDRAETVEAAGASEGLLRPEGSRRR